MDNKIILRVKPKVDFRLIFSKLKDNTKKYIFIFLICFFCITCLIFKFMFFYDYTNDFDSFISSIIPSAICSLIFMLGLFAPILSFLSYREREYRTISYNIYPDKLVIENENPFNRYKNELELKHIKDIIVTQTNIQKKINLSTIRFITDETTSKNNFCFENIEGASLVYQTIKKLLGNEEYIDIEEDSPILIIKPSLNNSSIYYKKTKNNNSLKYIFIVLFILGLCFYFYIKSTNVLDSDMAQNTLISFAIILLGSIFLISVNSYRKEIESLTYKIYKDKIIFENDSDISETKVLYFSDIDDVEIIPSYIDGTSTIAFKIKQKAIISKNDLSSLCMKDIKDPLFVCAKIKELMAINNNN